MAVKDNVPILNIAQIYLTEELYNKISDIGIVYTP